jgi:predicted HicB family RNase H-like nuclease
MQDEAKLFVRIPRYLKDWLDVEAERDERSLSLTVIRMLRERMEQQKQASRKNQINANA